VPQAIYIHLWHSATPMTNNIDYWQRQANRLYDRVFKIETLPGYKFTPPKGSFSKTKCGEYVFERYVRFKYDHNAQQHDGNLQHIFHPATLKLLKRQHMLYGAVR
jgi:hypothetical protein